MKRKPFVVPLIILLIRQFYLYQSSEINNVIKYLEIDREYVKVNA